MRPPAPSSTSAIRRSTGWRASEDGTVVLAVGGWPDRPYHALPWEPIFLASEAMRSGDWAAAAATLEREAGESLDTAPVQFRLACCHARLGEHERALGELRRAIELNAGVRERAATEPAFEGLRGSMCRGGGDRPGGRAPCPRPPGHDCPPRSGSEATDAEAERVSMAARMAGVSMRPPSPA